MFVRTIPSNKKFNQFYIISFEQYDRFKEREEQRNIDNGNILIAGQVIHKQQRAIKEKGSFTVYTVAENLHSSAYVKFVFQNEKKK